VQESQKKLGGVMQILSRAKQRQIKQAREQLLEADNKLQQARSRPTEKAGLDISSAESSLKQAPRVSKEFADALAEAQNGAAQAFEASNKNDTERLAKALDKAQDGVAKALEALQDEEQQEREQQQEMDSSAERSQQDLLTTQGVLDAGWRKLILNEISRLRALGEPPDSPSLKFLESRLR
jgi:hypothetical protein